MADTHGDGLVAEELPRDSLDEHDGQEHRNARERRRRHRRGHLVGPVHRGARERHALFAFAIDRLQHHDGVVDEHSNSQRQPSERHDVERNIEAVHEQERRHHRERNRRGDDGRAAEIAQEQEQNADGEKAADHGRIAHFLDRLLDEMRLVEQHRELVARRELLLPLVEPRLHVARRRDGVGVTLLEDGDFDALLAVDARDLLALLVAHLDAGHVAQAHRRAVALGHDDLADLLDAVELVQGPDEEVGIGAAQGPPRHVHIGNADHLAHLVDGNGECCQPLLVDVDLDLVLETALDLRGGDPLDGLQVELDLALGQPAHVVELTATGECDAHDRIERRVEAQHDGVLGFLRENQAVELLAHFHGQHVHVGVPIELERHLGNAGARDGVNGLEAAQHADGFFHRARDEVFNLLRRGIGEVGLNRQGRIGDVGKELERQTFVADDSKSSNRERGHHDRHTAPDRVRDETAHSTNRLLRTSWPPRPGRPRRRSL